MTDEIQTEPDVSGVSRFLPLLLILFAGTGCAGLIYEIVWFQLLQLVIGSTAISLGVVLTAFMGGLAIGSIALPRLRSAQVNPLRAYAVVELGVALYGVIALSAIPIIGRLDIGGQSLPGMLTRGLIACICLLPPTVLMGASLPLVVRWIKSTPGEVSWWAILYGVNTAGAVLGCLLAGFYLLRVYDMATATYVAAAINALVAAVSFGLASRIPVEAIGVPPVSSIKHSQPSRTCWAIYLVIALSGACAIGAEVIWTRLMAMMLGSTVYVFSIILAVFLVGLAMGSGAASWLLRAVHPRLGLGWSQVLLSLAIAWTAYMIADSLPYWPANGLLENNPWHNFQVDLLRCLAALLPPTLLWGASFPFACASIASPGEDPGKLVGNIYAANTLGSIIGALGISLILIPAFGTQQSQRVLLVLSAASGLALLVPYLWKHRSRAVAAVLAAATIVIIAGLTKRVHAIPGALIAYGRRMTLNSPSSRVLYTAEGMNSSVAITRWDDGSVEVDVNGHVEATTEPFDMKLQRMVGHLPGLLHRHPQSVLGIGFGAGVSAGTFTRYPSIQKITICEIEPIIPPTSTRYFAREDYDVLHNPRTRIIYDDARHYVLTTSEKFDIIASDPLDVFVKGTAAIYSKEYFEAVKRHLNPGGMFTLYVPLYESDVPTVQSELATFFDVFPYGTIWANTRDGQGYDMVFLGQAESLQVNLDDLQQRLQQRDYGAVAESLQDIGIVSPVDLLSSYAGQLSDLAPWLKSAPINRDRNLRLQYLAGWGINSQIADQIYRQILSYRHLPSNLFVGSAENLESLQRALSFNTPGTQ
jgi:spermidine synthase